MKYVLICVVIVLLLCACLNLVDINRSTAVSRNDACAWENYQHDTDAIDATTWNLPYPVFAVTQDCK